jgi:nucleotide-binding universal stress UspA family protein
MKVPDSPFIKHILCPVDLSEGSRRALAQAAALAGSYSADITVMSVRPLMLAPALWLEYPVAFPVQNDETRQQAEAAVRAFVEETVNVQVRGPIVREGLIVPEILRAIGELKADIVVMGTHGVGGFEHFLLGSVAERVLRKAPCAVLTVPPAVAVEAARAADRFSTILCAIDFSHDSERALRYAVSLTARAAGRLVLVHVLEQFEENEPRLSAHFNVSEFRRTLDREAHERLAAMIPSETAGLDLEIVVAHGKASREVLRAAQERRADLVVLGVHGRNALDLSLFGSTTQNVLHRAACPVLTVPRVVTFDAKAA